MDGDREDATSLQGGASDGASEAAGAVTVTDSTLAVPDENKNGESNTSSESGLEVDRVSLGHGSGGSESEKEFEPTEMVRAFYKLESKLISFVHFALIFCRGEVLELSLSL